MLHEAHRKTVCYSELQITKQTHFVQSSCFSSQKTSIRENDGIIHQIYIVNQSQTGNITLGDRMKQRVKVNTGEVDSSLHDVAEDTITAVQILLDVKTLTAGCNQNQPEMRKALN